MISVVKSMCLYGLEGLMVDVEVDISNGMPCWDIVGLADTSIKESKERVRTAIKNCGFELQSRKYIINLSPSNIHKNGPSFDLAIAIGILLSMKIIKNTNLEDVLFIGELSLDAKIKKVNGILPICLSAKENGIKKIILSKENAKEAAIVNGIEVIGVTSLMETINYLNNKIQILAEEKQEFNKNRKESMIDFSEVKGQKIMKRGLEIAAAGGHNVAIIGSPGSGKSMIAERIPTILPYLNFEESIEITKIYSLLGKTPKEGLIEERPFRKLHHSITETALIGGGRYPKPGEISLAHLGVLYLDEFLEYSNSLIEALRIPMEDKQIHISRNGIATTFPCNFMIIASMNPCPCGYYGSKIKKCTCTENKRNSYIAKLSGPIKDRFDIQISVFPVDYEKIKEKDEEDSKTIRERVNNARKLQIQRYKNENIFSNSDLKPKQIEKYCKIDEESEKLLKISFEKLCLSMRGYYKILKIARTIADLENHENILKKHIIEAIQFKSESSIERKI